MKTIKCLKDLEDYTLCEGDIVKMKGCEYEVNETYLNNLCGGNDMIFKELGIDKYSLCDKAYGYTKCGGDWPTYNSGDYAAATCAVKALYEIIEGKIPVEKETTSTGALPEKWVVKGDMINQMELTQKLYKGTGWGACDGYIYSNKDWNNSLIGVRGEFTLIDIKDWAILTGNQIAEEKKFPSKWLVAVDKDHPYWSDFTKWFCEKSESKRWIFYDKYYGYHGKTDYLGRGYTSEDTSKDYTIITLEQWDEWFNDTVKEQVFPNAREQVNTGCGALAEAKGYLKTSCDGLATGACIAIDRTDAFTPIGLDTFYTGSASVVDRYQPVEPLKKKRQITFSDPK